MRIWWRPTERTVFHMDATRTQSLADRPSNVKLGPGLKAPRSPRLPRPGQAFASTTYSVSRVNPRKSVVLIFPFSTFLANNEQVFEDVSSQPGSKRSASVPSGPSGHSLAVQGRSSPKRLSPPSEWPVGALALRGSPLSARFHGRTASFWFRLRRVRVMAWPSERRRVFLCLALDRRCPADPASSSPPRGPRLWWCPRP